MVGWGEDLGGTSLSPIGSGLTIGDESLSAIGSGLMLGDASLSVIGWGLLGDASLSVIGPGLVLGSGGPFSAAGSDLMSGSMQKSARLVRLRPATQKWTLQV